MLKDNLQEGGLEDHMGNNSHEEERQREEACPIAKLLWSHQGAVTARNSVGLSDLLLPHHHPYHRVSEGKAASHKVIDLNTGPRLLPTLPFLADGKCEGAASSSGPCIFL